MAPDGARPQLRGKIIELRVVSPLAVSVYSESSAVFTNGVQQVGDAFPLNSSATHAVLWSGSAGSAVDLGVLLPGGFSNSKAVSIDAAGDVFGTAVDPAGRLHIIEWAPLFPDFNRDGSVGFDDLLTVAQQYGRTSASFEQGDANSDGKVDFADLLELAQHYGERVAQAQSVATTASTPEPTTGLLVMLTTTVAFPLLVHANRRGPGRRPGAQSNRKKTNFNRWRGSP